MNYLLNMEFLKSYKQSLFKPRPQSQQYQGYFSKYYLLLQMADTYVFIFLLVVPIILLFGPLVLSTLLFCVSYVLHTVLHTYFGLTVILLFLLTIGIYSFLESRLILTSVVILTSLFIFYCLLPVYALYNPFLILLFLPLICIGFLMLVKAFKEHKMALEKYHLYLFFFLSNFIIIYGATLCLLFYIFSKQPLLLVFDIGYFFTLDGFFLLMRFPKASRLLPFNCIFGLDGIAMVFLILTYILITACIFFLWKHVRIDNNFILYISQLLLLTTQLQLTFTALDLLTFFLAFESLLIPMIILIALWGSKNNRQANNYLIFYTMVSAIPMLLAILYLKFKLGYTSLFTLKMVLYKLTTTEKMMVWLSFFFAFAVKTPMVPVHIWLPKTHVDAPTVGSVMLAGVLLKVGLIGMIRFLFPLFPTLTHFFAPYITAIATIGVIYASLITLRQIDAKRIIAYSSVAHMNMAMVSLCSLNYVGLYSTIYLMVSHGLIASGLFFLVGFLYNRFHVRSIYYYSGLATCMPYFAIYFFLFTLANMAFPLTSGFIGEFLLLLGITLNNFYLGFLNSLSMLLTTVYSVLLFGRVFLGELKVWLEQSVLKYIHLQLYNKATNTQSGKTTTLDLDMDECLIVGSLFIFILLLGIYPEILFILFDKGSFLMLTVFMV
jgi:proton-translocating NADH-quinone oxidoreductase chain M